jgi:hypothetical protein
MEISTGNVRHGGATGLVPVDVPKARHLPENVGPDKDRAQRGNWRGLTVEPEPPASHFTVADLTIRDVLVILKGAGCGAVVSGIVIGIWGAFGASLSPTAGAVILVLAAILWPQFVAKNLAYLGKFLTTVAGWLERSRLGQRIFVGLMAIAVLGAGALMPSVGFLLLGAILGAAGAYDDIRRRRVSELTTDAMV